MGRYANYTRNTGWFIPFREKYYLFKAVSSSSLIAQTLDVLLHYVIRRMWHSAMVEALHLIERNVRMTYELEHTPEVCLLFIASVEFQFAVARDDDHGRSIGTDVRERCILVDGRLKRTDTLLLAYVVVRDALAAEWDETRQTVGIDTILGQPLLLQAYHVEQITAG